jgi:hypothetical protein
VKKQDAGSNFGYFKKVVLSDGRNFAKKESLLFPLKKFFT